MVIQAIRQIANRRRENDPILILFKRKNFLNQPAL